MTQVYPVLASKVVLTSANNVLSCVEDGGAGQEEATIAAGSYYLYGDGTEANDLCLAIKTALDAMSVTSGQNNTYTVSYSAKLTHQGVTGALTIATDGTDIEIEGSNVATTFDLEILGHQNGVDTGAAASLTSTLSPKSTWVGTAEMQEIIHDGYESQASVHHSPSGHHFGFSVGTPSRVWDLDIQLLPEDRVRTSVSAVADGDQFRAIHEWWVFNRLQDLRLYAPTASSASTLNTIAASVLLGTFFLREVASPPSFDMRGDSRLYDVTLPLRANS